MTAETCQCAIIAQVRDMLTMGFECEIPLMLTFEEEMTGVGKCEETVQVAKMRRRLRSPRRSYAEWSECPKEE